MITIGAVYKIYCVDDSAPQLYVGSTKNYEQREQSHRNKCNNPESDAYMRRVYRYIRENGGWDQFRMKPIETVEFEDVLELRLHERYWIEKLKTTLNCCIPTRSDAEWRTENKEIIAQKSKVYREQNAEIIAQKSKVYREQNAEIIAQNKKEYREQNAEIIAQKKKEFQQTHAESIAKTKKAHYEANKEQITRSINAYREVNREAYLQRHKDYYQENKAKQLCNQGQLFTCECGKELTIGKRARHLLSARHVAFAGTTPELEAKIEVYKSKERAHAVKNSEYVTCECGQQITKNKLARHRKTARHLALILHVQTISTPDITPIHDNREPREASV